MLFLFIDSSSQVHICEIKITSPVGGWWRKYQFIV